MQIRFAGEADYDRINALRRQVNDLHVAGKPEIFKPGFSEELQAYLHVILADPSQAVAVAEQDGLLCGFAVLHRIKKPETPFMKEREYLDIDEFCVDAAYRKTGVGTALMEFIRAFAKAQGYSRIELNMWEFNADALAFYEAVGFTTYRRYLELPL